MSAKELLDEAMKLNRGTVYLGRGLDKESG